MPINHPDATVDVEFWSKISFWTPEQAIALACGVEPKSVTKEMFRANGDTPDFAKKYARMRQWVYRAIDMKQLDKRRIDPVDFLDWAKRRGIDLPHDLVEQIEKLAPLRTDWQFACHQLKKQRDQLRAELEKIKAANNNEQSLPERNNTYKEPDSLSDSERNTLLKLVLGMAMSAYRYDPRSTRNTATGEKIGSITVDLARAGLEMDADTIRKYLKEAEQKFIDRTPKPDKS